VSATFKISPEDGNALRLTMTGQKGYQIMLGEIPSIRRRDVLMANGFATLMTPE